MLTRQLFQLFFYLQEIRNQKLENIAHTLCIGRCHFPYRAAVVVDNVETLQKKLQFPFRDVLVADNLETHQKKLQSTDYLKGVPKPPKIAFLFPDLDCFYPQMASILFQNQPIFKDVFNTVARAIKKSLDLNLSDFFLQNNKNNINQSLYRRALLFTAPDCEARVIRG